MSKSIYIQSSELYPIAALWALGAFSIVGVIASDFFITTVIGAVLFIGTFLASFFVSLLSPSKKNNSKGLLLAGCLLLFVNVLMILDWWSEVAYRSDSCGEGFGTGNCFLADGMGVLSYVPFIVFLSLIATVLFTVNIRKKQGKRK